MKHEGSNGEEVTLRMVMDHMQLGFSSVRKEIKRLDARMDRSEKKMDTIIADLHDRWRWLDSHELPKRVSKLEDKVFAGINP